MFKTYFKLNSISLSKNILRAIQAGGADIPPLSAFPKAHQVTFKYYVGVIHFLEENYALVWHHMAKQIPAMSLTRDRRKKTLPMLGRCVGGVRRSTRSESLLRHATVLEWLRAVAETKTPFTGSFSLILSHATCLRLTRYQVKRSWRPIFICKSFSCHYVDASRAGI
jgi:hypothetical protein